MNRPHERYHVNLLKPKEGGMREEVGIILAVLLGWGVMTFGSQALLSVFGDSKALSVTDGFSLFNLPLHFFFIGQFLPLWFVILCFIFNLYIDRMNARLSRRKDRSYE